MSAAVQVSFVRFPGTRPSVSRHGADVNSRRTGYNVEVGSFTRSERMAKWNEGLRLAEQLHDGRLPPRAAFPWGR
jgi:hypothetical protein